MAEDIGRELDWDESIELNPATYVLLPEGEYTFTVMNFERQRFPGSAKLPACPKAELTLQVDSAQGTATIKHNLFLHTKTSGLLSAFFISIGQGKQGDVVRMDWSKAKGATGRAKIGVRTYTKKDGSEGQSNEIVEFLPPLKAWSGGGF